MRRRLFEWSMATIAFASLVTAPRPAMAQVRAAVSGTVVDSVSRRPIVGASVSVAGTTRGTVTDDAGTYSLRNIPAGSVTLRTQRLGFQPVSRSVTLSEGQQAEVNFALVEAPRSLTEIVVTGYGTSSRASISNSVTTVQGTEIENSPDAGIDGALQGRAAGVQVTHNAGNPGAGITVRVRGSASLSASNQPLYVVDGVPLIREDNSQLDVGGQDVTGVTGLNPDEVESITVLKDAAAASIYGSRGSNGVVMITTKRGRTGGSKVSFNTYTGMQSVERKWPVLNATQYLEYMNEAAAESGYGDDYFGVVGVDDSVDTDWQDEIFRNAPIRNITLNATGGNDRIQYFANGSFFDQQGLVTGSGYNRESGRVNLDFIANDRLSFRSSLSVSREDHDRVENDNSINASVGNAIAVQPYFPVRQPDGSYTSPTQGLEYTNPLALNEFNSVESRVFRSYGNIEAIYNFGPSWKLNGKLGADVLNLRDLRWDSPRVIGTYAAGQAGVATQGNSTSNRYLVEGFATYDLPSNDMHTLSVVGGSSVEWNGTEIDYIQGEGFGNEEFRYVGNAAKVTVYDGGWTGDNLLSVFGRANYSLLDRYLVTASVRTDGSSRFGKNNRYGVFPAASFGWVLSDEPALQSLKNLAGVKLRASLGRTGNQALLQDFPALQRFGKAHVGEEPGLAQTSLGNPDLRWEATREVDIGIDLTFLGGRFSVIADRYVKTTKDLLVNRPITSTSGQTSILQNIGSIENRGFEFTFGAGIVQPSTTNGFSWTSDFNIAFNDNKVKKLYLDQPFNTGIRDINRVEVGQPLGAFYAIKFLGVDPATGDAKYEDLNSDGDINSGDRQILGSPHPD